MVVRMNKNIENYKKALDELKASDTLKEKTLKNILNVFSIASEKKKRKSKKLSNRNYNESIEIFNNMKNKKRRSGKSSVMVGTYSLTALLVCAVAIVSIILYNNMATKNMPGLALENTTISDELQAVEINDVLPKVGKIENLKALLDGMSMNLLETNGTMSESSTMEFMADTAKLTNSSSKNYTKTNIQVEGVDEADIVKTDGNYIYYIANRKVYIVNVQTPKNPKIESVLEYEEKIIPREMYINDNKMVLILDKSDVNEIYSGNSTISYDVAVSNVETQIITYDIRNKNSVIEKRKIEVDGRYLSSRMINEDVYVITNKYIYKTNEEVTLPKYMDSAKDNIKHDVSVENMLYVPETKSNNYLIITGFSLNNNKEANIKTVLGAGQEIYCTEDSLYITSMGYAENEWETVNEKGEKKVATNSLISRRYYTNIYKFKLEKTNVISTAIGKVSGRPLNQFSMGEYEGNFGIATTENIWQNKSNNEIKNTLYILNENLEQIGILENISDGENLYAVRFMGDKAYMVTFKQVDPLFVIDISKPTEPKILGELKIPGFSSYLHPYDETHLIGIGQDVEVQQTKYGERTVTKGVKVSLFDISDYTNPKEVQSLVINEKSYSDASYDHKAVLFSKERNILAFPIISNVDNETKSEYVVLSIDLENGIGMKEKITHEYEDENIGILTAIIDRGLYIGEYLFTLSRNGIIVLDANGERYSLVF